MCRHEVRRARCAVHKEPANEVLALCRGHRWPGPALCVPRRWRVPRKRRGGPKKGILAAAAMAVLLGHLPTRCGRRTWPPGVGTSPPALAPFAYSNPRDGTAGGQREQYQSTERPVLASTRAGSSRHRCDLYPNSPDVDRGTRAHLEPCPRRGLAQHACEPEPGDNVNTWITQARRGGTLREAIDIATEALKQEERSWEAHAGSLEPWSPLVEQARCGHGGWYGEGWVWALSRHGARVAHGVVCRVARRMAHVRGAWRGAWRGGVVCGVVCGMVPSTAQMQVARGTPPPPPHPRR